MTTHASNIPKKASDFVNLAEKVNTMWASVGLWLTLLYITQPQFATLVLNLRNLLTGRQIAGGTRPIETLALMELDHQIDMGVATVKRYIAYKFQGHDPTYYYASFGLVHYQDHWIFPVDRDQRKDNLQLMIDAIAANGMTAEPCGTAYWTTIQSAYGPAYNVAKTIDGTISTDVADITVLRAQVNQVLVSIEEALKANYPTTYHGVWRNWGFQKEDY